MKNRNYLLLMLISVIAAVIVGFVGVKFFPQRNIKLQLREVNTQKVNSLISADGEIKSQNEATLHFQTAGKLVYLPFKEGDSVQKGQIIAQLDERTIQKNIQSAVDEFQNQKINFNNVNDFNGDRMLADTGLSVSARRQLETALNSLDQTQVAVDIAQIARDQSIITSPFSGIIASEDVKVPNVNVTPLNSFTVIDPKMLIFRANILAQDIDFISLGAKAKINLDGSNQTAQGTVLKIYPEKKTLSTGENVYQADIQSEKIDNIGKYQQAGTVFIQSNTGSQVVLVPIWTVLSHKYIWVANGDKTILKKVSVGNVHGSNIEILNGLSSNDKVVVNPEAIAKKYYSIL